MLIWAKLLLIAAFFAQQHEETVGVYILRIDGPSTPWHDGSDDRCKSEVVGILASDCLCFHSLCRKMNTCTEVREYIDHLICITVLGYWMTCSFLYFCCNAATASTIWNQRRRNMSGTSILYGLWPLDSGWLSELLFLSGYAIWRGQLSLRPHPSHSEIVVLASGQDRRE